MPGEEDRAEPGRICAEADALVQVRRGVPESDRDGRRPACLRQPEDFAA